MFLVSAGGQVHALEERGVDVSVTAPDHIHRWRKAKEGGRERACYRVSAGGTNFAVRIWSRSPENMWNCNSTHGVSLKALTL